MRLYPLALLGLAVLVGCGSGPSQEPLTLAPNTVVLPEAEVDSATATEMNVQTDKTLSTGQLVISDEGEGLVRRITQVQQTGSARVGTQIVRKVYLRTENASLEQAIASGEANLDLGELPIDDSNVTQSLPGISAQAFSGRINLTNVSFSPPGISGVTVTLNGYIEQNLQPKFNLKFSSGSVEKFQSGLSGSLKASVSATLQANKSFSAFSANRQLAAWNIKRVVMVGSVPVVVVLQPKLIAAVSSGASGQVKVTVGIAPTFTTDMQLNYDRLRPAAQRWQNTFKASFALNPTFSYETPAGGSANASTGLAMDVKFYGLLGPSLEAKPFMNLSLNALNPTAALKTGINGASKVEAGFNVLGKDLETAYNGPTVEEARNFSCTAPGTCSASGN